MTPMEEIMKKLGVGLGEKFNVEVKAHVTGGYAESRTFTDVYFYIEDNGEIKIYGIALNLFLMLLNGKAKIIKKPYRPELAGTYYYVNAVGCVSKGGNYGGAYDKTMILIGNCYKTEGEAKKHIDYWKRVYKDMPEFKGVE